MRKLQNIKRFVSLLSEWLNQEEWCVKTWKMCPQIKKKVEHSGQQVLRKDAAFETQI